MKYNITLVAGCRPKGLAQFISDAERKDAESAWAWLTAYLSKKIIFAYPKLNAVTAELTSSEAAQLLRDYRILTIEPIKDIQLHKTIQSNAPWHLSYLQPNTDPSYTYDTTGKGVLVAIFDAGVDTENDEFEDRAITVFDAYPGIALDSDHGTHVAGLAGSKTFGVAKECGLLSLRVLLEAGGSDAAVVAGIDWLLANWDKSRPLVANFSLGGVASIDSWFLEDAIAALIIEGVIVCVSAGNEAEEAILYTPARMSEVITVGAIDSSFILAPYSNFGSSVDILAPGSDIYSTSRDQGVLKLSGTSMSAPIVSGVIARLLERQPMLTQAEVKSRLLAYKRDIVAKLPEDELYEELNLTLPLEDQIPPKLYSLTTTDLLASDIPSIILGTAQMSLPGVNPFSGVTLRPFFIINGEKVYGEAKKLVTLVGPGIVTHVGTRTIVRGTAIKLNKNMSIQAQPQIEVAQTSEGVRLIGLTLDPATTLDLSFKISSISGTFNYTTLLPAPQLKAAINIQALTGIVERVKSILARGSAGKKVEGRILPYYLNEYVSINLPPSLSYRAYTTAEIVSAICTQAGISVFNGLSGILYAEYTFTGRFIDALEGLAQDTGGRLVQQNGTWLLLALNATPKGHFEVPSGDVISLDIDTQADVKDRINSLIQTRKSLGKELVTTARTLKDLLQEKIDSSLPKEKKDTSNTASDFGFNSLDTETFATGTGLSLNSLKSKATKTSKKVGLLELLATSDNPAQVSMPRTTVSSLQPLQLEFGMKAGKWQPIAGTTDVVAPSWSWDEWDEADEAQHKQSKKFGYLTDYYQIQNVKTLSTASPKKRGLTEVDVFTEIRVAIDLPSSGGVLKASGKLENLTVDGGWSSSGTSYSYIPYKTEVYSSVDADGFTVWKNRYYIIFNAVSTSRNTQHAASSTGTKDNKLYSANLSLSYEVWNAQPYEIDGKLTLDNFLVDKTSGEALAKLEGNIFHGLTKPSLGTYDSATGKLKNLEDSTIGTVKTGGEITSLNGTNIGTLETVTYIDAPIFSSKTKVVTDKLYDSQGQEVGSIINNVRLIVGLNSETTKAAVEPNGTVIAYLDNSNNLVTKYNNRRIGIWVDNGILNMVKVEDSKLVVAGRKGVSIFGLPDGTKIGDWIDLPVQRITNRVIGTIKGIDVYKGTTSTKIGSISYNDTIVSIDGTEVAQLESDKLVSIGTEAYKSFGLTVGAEDAMFAAVYDKPAGIYGSDNKFIAALEDNIVVSPNGTVLGEVITTGVLKDATGDIALLNSSGQIMALNGKLIGQYMPSVSSTNPAGTIIRDNRTVGLVTPSTEMYLKPDGSLKNALDPLKDTGGADDITSNNPALIPGTIIDDKLGEYQNDTIISDNASDSVVDSIADAIDKNDLKEDIAAANLDQFLAFSNMSSVDRLLYSYGAGGVIPYLDSILQIEYALDELNNPPEPTEFKQKSLVLISSLKAQEYALQRAITAAENNILAIVAEIKTTEEITVCSFIYNNILPLPANSIQVFSNTYGMIDDINYSDAVVSVTAKRLLL